MTAPLETAFLPADADRIAGIEGRIAVLIDPEGRMDPLARRANRLMRGALARLAESDVFRRMKPGEGHRVSVPAGLAAEAVLAVKLPRRPRAEEARKAGSAIAKFNGPVPLTLLAGSQAGLDHILTGLLLRAYSFDLYRKRAEDEPEPNRHLAVMVRDPAAAEALAAPVRAAVEGVFLARDLVAEPANVLTTTEFAARLEALAELGVSVEILDEKRLEDLGMRTLLAVARGSETPPRVVVMEWRGGGDAAPLALVGKGVVFDTGGISIKPSAGMEEMTMDMAGAAVVAGVMRTLALRRAKANVVGIVGLVENMPDGRAQRPGDVVRSMKGDTVEVINTDAEGRLVLADAMWYAQDRFQPAALIDLATLTGAIIIALGHEKAGVFGNDDALAGALLAAAEAEGEGAWRMPLAPAYDKKLKSRIADIANVGGRDAGSITAAQFLGRFVREGMPWLHLDIAGVAYRKEESELAPKGPTGWGVRTLDRLIRDRYER
jgi:leucyl aminopeptidase